MDLRDEVSGSEGVVRIDHFLRTGFEIFTAVGMGDYVAEKAETSKGWIFPVGDEVNTLGYNHMFADMFDSIEQDKTPMESFYDGYIVNAIIDACYLSAKSKKWETVMLDIWRGRTDIKEERVLIEYDANHYLVKEEKLPDGRKKLILKEKEGGNIVEQVI
jgi:hypothetical protein